MSIFIAEDLSIGYDGQTVASDLNFTVEVGDYLFIVGENGSGKTTLMRTLLNLQPPLGGRIITEEGLGPGEIGYLPQQTAIQKDFPASVWEIVLSGCQGRCGARPFYGREEKQLAAANLNRLGIANLSRRCYRELSGGQQQRVLLARALCATGRVLILDEPVTGLDPKATADMYELIAGLNREGLTVIMISHDVEAAVRYGSHILHLGAEAFFGTTPAYLKSDAGKIFLLQQKGGGAR